MLPLADNEDIVTFRSNEDIAIVVTDISEAEWYHGGVFGFKIKKKAWKQTVLDTGQFTLYISEGEKSHPMPPSFTVRNLKEAI